MAVSCGRFAEANGTGTDRLQLSNTALTCLVHNIPNSNNTRDWGTSSLRWRDCYLVNNPNVSSDERIKKDIEPLPYGLNIIEQLEPKQYKFNELMGDDNKLRFGLIAQDVENLFNDHDYSFINKGSDDPNNIIFKSLDYVSLIPILINSVKELSQKVELLEQKLNNLS